MPTTQAYDAHTKLEAKDEFTELPGSTNFTGNLFFATGQLLLLLVYVKKQLLT